MATTLSRQSDLRLQHTLEQWRQWRCDPPLTAKPQQKRPLGDGHSNYSVLVGCEMGREYVVRIDGTDAASHGLNRQAEWRILQSAHGAGLAPAPRYFNPDLGALVCDYLTPDPSQVTKTADLAGLLRSIHQLPGCHQRLDLRDRTRRYEKLLQHRATPLPSQITAARSAVFESLAIVAASAEMNHTATVLCHNDLLSANRILCSGSLWAIDWEYSAMGSPWYELAVIIDGDGLAPAESEQLLRAYLQRAATPEEALLLRHHRLIYRYLELLWYLLQGTAAIAVDAWQMKLRSLISPESC